MVLTPTRARSEPVALGAFVAATTLASGNAVAIRTSDRGLERLWRAALHRPLQATVGSDAKQVGRPAPEGLADHDQPVADWVVRAPRHLANAHHLIAGRVTADHASGSAASRRSGTSQTSAIVTYRTAETHDATYANAIAAR